MLYFFHSEKTADELRDATTGPSPSPAKWLLRNESRNSILTTCHYPDLGSTSDWLKNISLAAPPVTSITQIWVVRRRQYGISAFISQTSFNGETHDDVAKCRLFSQVTTVVIIVSFLGDERSEWREGKMQEIELIVNFRYHHPICFSYARNSAERQLIRQRHVFLPYCSFQTRKDFFATCFL